MKQLTLITTDWVDDRPAYSEQQLSFQPDAEGIEKDLVTLYPGMKYQRIYGFGGALTESAGYVLAQMPEESRQEILSAYYGKDGLGYTWARTHIDSCDFSLGYYEAMGRAEDTSLQGFSLQAAEKYVLPLIRQANTAAGKPLAMMMTPWSPPAFMKSNKVRNQGGKLLEEYYPLWAEYICRYIKEYQSQGVDVQLLSLQNEPKAAQTWDSCLFTAEEEREYIRRYLAPALKAHGLEQVGIIIWDHNKERVFERAEEVIQDAEMQQLVAGVAVHWYSGDHFESLAMVREKFPDKRIVFSEACVEYNVIADQNQLGNAQMYAHDLIGDLNNGLDTFIDWNIILDQQGGPNHVKNYCDAPIMCDLNEKTWRKNLSYEYIGHFSKYIRPGARRIGFSRFTDRLEVTAVENQDGSLAVVWMNQGDSEISFFLRLENEVCKVTAKPHSIATAIVAG